MKFQALDKNDRERLMNKLIKSVKQEVKNTPNEDPNNLLSKACLDAMPMLYEFMLKHIDYSDGDTDIESD